MRIMKRLNVVERTHDFDRCRSCCAKVMYLSERVAAEAASDLEKIYGHKFRHYKCEFCKNYHLTKTKAGYVHW